MPRSATLLPLAAPLALALLAACGETPTTPSGSLAPAAPVLAVGGGNSMNAKACQKNGWQSLATSTGAPFASESACTSYAAKGGILYKRQTITFAPLAGRTYGDADFAVSATASSGLAVTLTASGDCTVSGATVHLTGAGSCTITARQAGDATWVAATDVPQTFAIAQGSQTITFTSAIPSPANVGATYTPAAAATSGLSVAFTLDAASTGCTISSGVVSFTAPGTCVIDADQAGDNDWSAAPQVSQSITTQVPCIGSDASLRAAAAAGGAHVFCAGAHVVLTGGQISVGTTLSLTATGPGNAIVNANKASRVFHVGPSGNLTLTNVTATGGHVAGLVGGGGGIAIAGGAVILNGSSAVDGNEANTGGGVFIGEQFSGGSLTLNDASRVSNNLASPFGQPVGTGGGGVFNNGASLVMNGTASVRDNTAADGGGARGGGVLNNAGSITLNGSSSITGNAAGPVASAGSSLGGGIYFVNGGSLTLGISTSISANQAASNGGGIFRIDNGFGTITVPSTSIITGNTPNNCGIGNVQQTPPVPNCQ